MTGFDTALAFMALTMALTAISILQMSSPQRRTVLAVNDRWSRQDAPAPLHLPLVFMNAGAPTSPQSTNDPSSNDDIIANVLGQITEDAADPGVSNIFAPAEKEIIPEPAAGVNCRQLSECIGTDTTIDLAKWVEDPDRAPRVVRGFDTSNDRIIVLAGATSKPPVLQVRHTAEGVSVLCCGTARLVALPGLVGDVAINALLLEVT